MSEFALNDDGVLKIDHVHDGGAAHKSSLQRHRVFVTKIPSSFTDQDVRAYFETFGNVVDFYMPTHAHYGHKGIAFVAYDLETDKESVLRLTPHIIQGREVVVDEAKPRDEPGVGKKPSAARNFRVFVTRISETLTKDDLEAYFKQFGALTDLFVPLKNPNDPDDPTHKGIAFVSFADKDTFEEVLSRDKYEVKPDVFVVVDRAAGKDGGKGGKGDSMGSRSGGKGYKDSAPWSKDSWGKGGKGGDYDRDWDREWESILAKAKGEFWSAKGGSDSYGGKDRGGSWSGSGKGEGKNYWGSGGNSEGSDWWNYMAKGRFGPY